MSDKTRMLLTGAGGFVGQAIKTELGDFEIVSMSRNSGDIVHDLTTAVPKLQHFEIVVHCAGKAHMIPKTDAEKKAFFDVNVKGTKNLLRGLELSEGLPSSFVLISSVAVYGVDTGVLITEQEPLNATQAYGLSKKQAEEITLEWCNKHGVRCTILRLPLVAGPNPPGNLGSMINAIRKGYYFDIAGGKAKKSIVLARDVAAIIPRAAKQGGIYNLTDGYHPSFAEIASHIAAELGKSKPLIMPRFIAGFLAKIGDLLGPGFPLNSRKLQVMGSDLTFDDSKARAILNWDPDTVLNGLKVLSNNGPSLRT